MDKWCQNGVKTKKSMVSKTEPLYNTKMSLFDTKRCDKVIAIKRVDGSKPSALFPFVHYRCALICENPLHAQIEGSL